MVLLQRKTTFFFSLSFFFFNKILWNYSSTIPKGFCQNEKMASFPKDSNKRQKYASGERKMSGKK